MLSLTEILGLIFQLRRAAGSGIIREMATPATIRRGSKGEDVKTWQNILLKDPKPGSWMNAAGVQRVWPAGWVWPITADGDFGDRTQAASECWQARRGLSADGIVGPMTWGKALGGDTLPAPPPTPAPDTPIPETQPEVYPFVQAKNYTVANRTKIDVIVIHDMEYPEKPTAAEWCADFFAGRNGLTAPKASAHYCVDSNSVVQCVNDKDVAWHAAGANHNGIGIEHSGYAKQSREEWLDDYSMAELKVSAVLVARLCKRWNIPVERISAADLKAGKRGICGHKDVTDAFSKGRGHYDPGPNFPYDVYIDLVKQAG